jgi:ATP-dependent DNA helicase DinG
MQENPPESPKLFLDADELCATLEETGAVASCLEGFERRTSQLDLLKLIVKAFNEDALLAAEAGTGVGKSFAYLLPALEFALAAKERVVISTATITLQQQLYEKDIPLVVSALGKDVKCVLLKGRGNYLCLKRFNEAMTEPPLDAEEHDELKDIAEWVMETKSGSRSDLPFLPNNALWARLCSEADNCLGLHCAEKERCFFMALRKEAAGAQILVVNHHLLFADLAARRQGAGYEGAVVLPPYSRVIIDEAHTIENSATSFFSRGWNRASLGRDLSRLYRKRRAMQTGLLYQLWKMLPSAPDMGGAMGSGFFTGAAGALDKVREASEKADEAALALCGSEGTYRFIQGGNDPLGALRPLLEALRSAIGACTETIRNIIQSADQEDTLIWEVNAILRRMENVAALCTAFLEYGVNGDDNEVFWLERRYGANPSAAFTVTPVSIAPSLKEALFDVNKTVVCVSATLSTGRRLEGDQDNESRHDDDDGACGAESFRFWAERTGAALADRQLLCGVFPSPFPFLQRTLLAVPKDAPMPDSQEYEVFTSSAISNLVRLTGGSALVLFTSYQSMRNAWDAAAPALEKDGIVCLKQGDDDRSRLLQQFLSEKTSVLFGTDSFWEGVDAPGETLRLVIVCRLPFRTLKEPVFEARREFLDKQGRSSFMELSLPDAVMKFKQGFGRLMRNSRDYGVVAVLDGRLLGKNYGKAFLAALPETRQSFKDFDLALEDVERFLFSTIGA